jgi:outer membrane immunogenic protein
MKKLLIALSAIAAFTAPALAADMATKAPMRAPVAYAPSWTGFYLFGGAGGGLWNADSNVVDTGGVAFTRDQRLGGSGWFGTVGGGTTGSLATGWLAFSAMRNSEAFVAQSAILTLMDPSKAAKNSAPVGRLA